MSNLTSINLIVVAGVPLHDDVALVGGNFDQAEIARRFDVMPHINAVVRGWSKTAGNRPTVVFAASIAHSIRLCAAFRAAGIPAEHVDGTTSKADREAVFARMREGTVTVLCNHRIGVEDIDLPEVSCVVLASPTKSSTVYRRNIACGTRPTSKRDLIVLDFGGDVVGFSK